MEIISRRSALAVGLGVAATSPLILPAAARTYGPDEGKEIAPGVRLVELGTRQSTIPAYKTIAMLDVVFQPGKGIPEAAMENDMVCQVPQGELLIKKGEKQFTVKEGEVYSCTKGEMEGATNTGSTVAIMRFIELRTA